MTTTKKELKIDHVYRVVGRTLENGRLGGGKQRLEALRYVGTMVPYRDGFADVDHQVELFYSFAKLQHFLFKPGTFQAEELLS